MLPVLAIGGIVRIAEPALLSGRRKDHVVLVVLERIQQLRGLPFGHFAWIAALAHWSGEYADDFVERIDTEQSVGVQLVGQLRGEADGWAVEWQRAMDQENWNRYAAAVKRVEHDRSLVDSFVGFFAGHDDLPSQPAPAGVPVAPGFWPTRSFANYSRY